MDNSEFTKIYTSVSVVEKSAIEEELSVNNIDYYSSEDLAMLLGHPTCHFYVKTADALPAVEILKKLYVRGSLSIECDSAKLDEIYRKLRSEQSVRADGETGSFMRQFFKMFVRPFSRSIAFGVFSIAAYAANIRVFDKSDIPKIIGALSLLVLIISLAIDMYFKKNKTEH
ncbi:MAG: hypothetical protein KA369_16790 [Spirochaetes bacterium]|nr:hypothetical protein [Spirochaetota bacterium]